MENKIKILYIISRQTNIALEFQWVAEYLDREKFELKFLFLNPAFDTSLVRKIKSLNIEVQEIILRDKKDIPLALWKTYQYIRFFEPDIVHTHLWEANFIGLLASWFAGVKKRIYTRHHSTLNHDFHPSAIKFDLLSNRLATNIVAITKSVEEVLVEKEKVSNEKITLIHHCIDVKQFIDVKEERVIQLKEKYQIPLDKKVVGVISRYVQWKGVPNIIGAFKAIHAKYPNTILVLANAGKGDDFDNIKSELKELSSEVYREISFESDLYALHKMFDVFVHTPIDKYVEAFGQVYVEAMVAKTPCVFTLSGIANDIIEHEKNALVVPYHSVESIIHAIDKILNDKELKDTLVNNAYNLIIKDFGIENKIRALENLYKIKNSL
jgi:glycosyltransferase involved in cell wall biosynthesis